MGEMMKTLIFAIVSQKQFFDLLIVSTYVFFADTMFSWVFLWLLGGIMVLIGPHIHWDIIQTWLMILNDNGYAVNIILSDH